MKQQGYNMALARVKQRQQREARLAAWLATHQKEINRIYKLVDRWGSGNLDLTIKDGVNITTGVDTQAAQYVGDDHQVQMFISVRQLQGLKDPILEEILTPLVDAPKSICKDWPDYLNRDYTFTWPLDGGLITVLVSAYVATENPTCRKILVDRQTVTSVKEIYKLSCDGDIIEGEPSLTKLEN